MPGHLDSIVALHQSLTEMDEAEALLAGIPDWMEELHQRHSVQKAQIDEKQAESEASAVERRTAEGAAGESQEKLKKYQEQISQVSTQREYGALLKEIDTTKEQVSTFEQQALEALERHDTLKGEIEELTSSFADLDSEYQEHLAKWEKQKPAVTRKVKKLARQTKKLREDIPRPIQALFDRLRDRLTATPLANVQRVEARRGNNATWFCSVCSYRVRPQLVVQIINEASVNQCDSCKRILHIITEEEAS